MQVKENVNLANLLQVGSPTGHSTPGPREDAAKDFASLLTDVRYQADAKVNVTNQASPQGKEVFPESTSTEARKEAGEFSKSPAASQTERTSANAMSDISETENVAAEAAEDRMDEDSSSAVEVIHILLQSIMQQLQLTSGELADTLQEMGMNPLDLLTEEGLKELFLFMNSAGATDLLVDEDLNLRLQSFLSELENALQTLDTTGLDADGEAVGDIVSDILDNLNATQTKEQGDGTGKVVSDSGWNEPEVVVVKQGTEDQSGNGSAAKHQSQEAAQSFETVDTRNTDGLAKEKQSTFENPVLQAIQDAVNRVEGTITAGSQRVTSSDIINQIVEQVRVHMSQNTTSLEMQLYPEHLGKIQIHVVSKDGIMTARIVAESEAAKQAIENGLTLLKDTMEQQNLKVDAIEVMVSTTGFEWENEQQDSTSENQEPKSRRKLSISEAEDEISKEDAVEAEKMKAVGSSVSYMA